MLITQTCYTFLMLDSIFLHSRVNSLHARVNSTISSSCESIITLLYSPLKWKPLINLMGLLQDHLWARWVYPHHHLCLYSKNSCLGLCHESFAPYSKDPCPCSHCTFVPTLRTLVHTHAMC